MLCDGGEGGTQTGHEGVSSETAYLVGGKGVAHIVFTHDREIMVGP